MGCLREDGSNRDGVDTAEVLSFKLRHIHISSVPKPVALLVLNITCDLGPLYSIGHCKVQPSQPCFCKIQYAV